MRHNEREWNDLGHHKRHMIKSLNGIICFFMLVNFIGRKWQKLELYCQGHQLVQNQIEFQINFCLKHIKAKYYGPRDRLKDQLTEGPGDLHYSVQATDKRCWCGRS